MSSKAQAVTLIVHAVIGLALIAAATVLAWHGTIDGQALTAILASAVGLVGGSAGTLAVVGFNQQSPPNSTAPATGQTLSPSGPAQ